jgi:hypothetical protein
VQYARVNPIQPLSILGRPDVTTAIDGSDVDEVRAQLEELHPEVDWEAVAAAPTGDVVWSDIEDALLAAGCNPQAVANLRA